MIGGPNMYRSLKDKGAYFRETNRSDELTVVIVDDMALRVVTGDETGDTRFVKTIADAIVDNKAAKRIVLADFSFRPEWVSEWCSPAECVYLVDLLAGEGEKRGLQIISALDKAGVPSGQIALFTKAVAAQLEELFGGHLPYTMLGKFVSPDGQAIGGPFSWGSACAAAIEFIVSCDDRYRRAVAVWSGIPSVLKRWPVGTGRGELFAVPERHDASWWVTNGNKPEYEESLRAGRDLWSRLLGGGEPGAIATKLSHKAVFCGLKAAAHGRMSARLLCEVGNVHIEDDVTLMLLKEPCRVGMCAEVLLAFRTLTLPRASSEPGFQFSGRIEKDALVFDGVCSFTHAAGATSAAATLSMAPDVRMQCEQRTTPGTGVTAAAKLRAYAANVVFAAEASVLRVTLTFEMSGRLE